MLSRNIPPSSSARADSGKRQNGSGEAQPTLKATQEEAEGSGWTRALRVRRICWLHGAETRHHERIQHCHCRWRDRDQLCCAEYPTGRHEGYHKSYCFIVIITSPISFFKDDKKWPCFTRWSAQRRQMTPFWKANRTNKNYILYTFVVK